jgi:hypothetical protein
MMFDYRSASIQRILEMRKKWNKFEFKTNTMSQAGIEAIENQAVRVSELIEEIIQINELLMLHKQHDAHEYEMEQYLDRRSGFAEELNGLLKPHQLRVVFES